MIDTRIILWHIPKSNSVEEQTHPVLDFLSIGFGKKSKNCGREYASEIS
jgi:hypothetical protein